MSKAYPEIVFSQKKAKESQYFELQPLKDFFDYLSSIKNHDPQSLHRIDFHIIIFNFGKRFSHFVDFQKCELGPGEALLISPGQVHAFLLDQKVDGYVIIFNQYFLEQFIAPTPLLRIRPIFNYLIGASIYSQLEVHTAFIRTLKPYLDHDDQVQGNTLIGTEMTKLLLTWSQMKSERSGSSEHYHIFDQFRRSVQHHYTESRETLFYSDLLGTSYKQLNEICHQLVNQTPKTIIDQIVLLEAKRKIASSDASMKELTYSMGFDSPTNFSKFFKKHTGMSPGKFKKVVASSPS